jgi:hypothetical protein
MERQVQDDSDEKDQVVRRISVQLLRFWVDALFVLQHLLYQGDRFLNVFLFFVNIYSLNNLEVFDKLSSQTLSGLIFFSFAIGLKNK